ncbi:MAG: glycosyltransferase family 4 protein [Actinobacteria bacterium]|nr:glycosyltransferase family 4 protein [Actinomycetota bacterium]
MYLNHNPVGIGTFYRCLNLGQQLAKRGYKITILCSSNRRFDFRIRSEIQKGLRIVTLPTTGFYDDRRKTGFYFGQLLRVFLGSIEVLRLDYDLLHSFAIAQPTTGIPTVVSKFFRNKPIIIDWDDAWSRGFTEYHNPVVGKTLEFFENRVPKYATKITVVSEYLKQRALDLGFKEEDIVKIPNGANVEVIKPLDQKEARRYLGIEEDTPIVVAMGHTYMRSMEILMEAFSGVVAKTPQAKLYLVGKIGRARGTIEEGFKKLKPFIVFTGEQPSQKIPYYLAAANVLALPMEDSVIEKARFPIRLGDYLASGRPIVSNAVGEVKAVLEEGRCGFVSDSEDVNGFAENILLALGDKGLSSEYGRRARKVAEDELAWFKVTKKLETIYREVVS